MFRTIAAAAIILSSVSVFADSFTFIENGVFKIVTRDNMNEDVVYDVMPPKYRHYLQPGDIGCMYQISDTGEMFFVLIHTKQLDAFNRGHEYGNSNVKIRVNYLTTYNRMKMYEFVGWSN